MQTWKLQDGGGDPPHDEGLLAAKVQLQLHDQGPKVREQPGKQETPVNRIPPIPVIFEDVSEKHGQVLLEDQGRVLGEDGEDPIRAESASKPVGLRALQGQVQDKPQVLQADVPQQDLHREHRLVRAPAARRVLLLGEGLREPGEDWTNSHAEVKYEVL